MYIPDRISTKLFGGVGFDNSTISGYDIVSETNQASISGLKFQDESSVVSIKNIKDTQENPSITDEQFNALLTKLQKRAILNVVSKVFSGQSDSIGSLNLFPFEKSFENTIEKRGKFVGFVIEPLRAGVSMNISWIELFFDEVASFYVYLFNSNNPYEAVASIAVETEANRSTIIYPSQWYIHDNETVKGGVFYIGYFESDLSTASAIAKDYESSNVYFRTPNFYTEPVSLDHTSKVIDVTSKVYETDTYGLNIGVEVYTDFTEYIIKNKNQFWRAIQLQMQEIVLNQIMFSTRNNTYADKNKENVAKASYELNGSENYKGITAKLNDEINNLKKFFFREQVVTKGTLTT